jgi:LPXTG-motif cell wall-anchored protein
MASFGLPHELPARIQANLETLAKTLPASPSPTGSGGGASTSAEPETPFYASPWFIVGGVVLAAGLGVVLYRRKKKQQLAGYRRRLRTKK